MNNFRYILIIFLLIISSRNALSQDETGPVKIKVKRIVFKAGNQYSVNIPNLAFHVLLQKSFDTIRSSVSADYDYRRKDMGFGMSHSLIKFVVNPGITVEDNLYFREVFNDSTGIWSRKQSISPFLIHEFNEKTTLGMNFVFEREWFPVPPPWQRLVQPGALGSLFEYQVLVTWDDSDRFDQCSAVCLYYDLLKTLALLRDDSQC